MSFFKFEFADLNFFKCSYFKSSQVFQFFLIWNTNRLKAAENLSLSFRSIEIRIWSLNNFDTFQ